MLQSISSLVPQASPTQGYARSTSPDADVLAVVTGPFESRASKKSEMNVGFLEVVVVSTDLEEDCRLLESLLKDCLGSLVDLKAYPYLTVTVTVVVFSAVGYVLGTAINTAYAAAVDAGLSVKAQVHAESYQVASGWLTVGVVPRTDLVLFSHSTASLDWSEYTSLVSLACQAPA